jgi:UDP-glucose 4-epimerase
MVKDKVLITGANGFLGSHCVKNFAENSSEIFTIGHRCVKDIKVQEEIDGEISLENLQKYKNIAFDIIIHCGGSGNVNYSFQNPLDDFNRSVNSTISVLEFVRKFSPNSLVIYPSTPAVQGLHFDSPIKESDPSIPISPYGVHKQLAEQLCLSYSHNFGIKTAIIRFFSIYGEGLKKQLIWDACNKMLKSENSEIEFWGTGEETRDWIYIDDAINLIKKVYKSNIDKPFIVNGGSGIRYTIYETLSILAKTFNFSGKIKFNKLQKKGDPYYYLADTTIANLIGWKPKFTLKKGIENYVKWFKANV